MGADEFNHRETTGPAERGQSRTGKPKTRSRVEFMKSGTGMKRKNLQQ